MQRLLAAIAILTGLTIPASAAATSAIGAETGSMILIGAGLILGATVSRLKTRRG